MKAPSNDANRPNASAPGKGSDTVGGTGGGAGKPGAPVQGTPPGGAAPRPDAARPGTANPAAPGTARTEAAKPDAAKDAAKDAVKPVAGAETKPAGGPSPAPQAGRPGSGPTPGGPQDAGKPGGPAAGRPGMPGSEPPKPATAPVDAAKPGTPGAAPRAEPPRPETAKAGPGGPEAAKPGEAKLGDAKPGDPKPGDPKTGDAKPGETGKPGPGKAEPFRAGAAVTDGPIIDLKAKRVPDPAEASRGANPGTTKPEAPRTEAGKSGPNPTGPGQQPKDGPRPTAASPIPQAAPARGPGFGTVAAAGLVGGLVGAGLLFGADRAGMLPPREDGRVAALEQRVAGLAPKDALAALDKRVAGNDAALKPLGEAVKSAEATAQQALARAGQAGGAPAEGGQGGQAAAPAVPPDLVARLDSLDQRVSALQEEPGKEGQAEVQAVPNLAALSDRLKALEDKSAAPAQAPDLDRKLAALQGEVETKTQANAEADRAIGQRLDALQQALDERVKAATEAVQQATQASQQAAEAGRTQAQEAAKTLERAQQEQAERIAALDKAVGQRAEAATVQAALRVVAADRVATALATGAPFAEPLATLRKLETGDAGRLDALAPFAEAGAPSTAQLAAEFRPVAEKAAAARRAAEARSVAESGDFKAKLLGMADAIVQVRKVDAPPAAGQQAGEDPVAKVQAALDRGALQDAATAFDALPAAAKAEAGPFGERLKARAAAAQAARGLLSDAFKGLPTGP